MSHSLIGLEELSEGLEQSALASGSGGCTDSGGADVAGRTSLKGKSGNRRGAAKLLPGQLSRKSLLQRMRREQNKLNLKNQEEESKQTEEAC